MRGQAHLALIVAFELILLVALGVAFSQYVGRLEGDTRGEARVIAKDFALSLSAMVSAPGVWAYSYVRNDLRGIPIDLSRFVVQFGRGVVQVDSSKAGFAFDASTRLASERFERPPWPVRSGPALLQLLSLPERDFSRSCSDLRLKSVVLDPGHGGSDKGVVSGSLSESEFVRSVANTISFKAGTRGAFVVSSTRDLSGDVAPDDRLSSARALPGVLLSLHASHDGIVRYWVPMGEHEDSSFALACHLSNSLPGVIVPVDASRLPVDDWRRVLSSGKPAVAVELGSLADVGAGGERLGDVLYGVLEGLSR